MLLDVVIDQAEIPTFQAVMDLDEDGDGEFSDDELLAAETAGCTSVGEALSLTIDGAAAPLRVIEAGVTFPPGNGGLSTMRLVCTLESPLAAPLAGPTRDRVRGPLRAHPHRLARDDRHRQRHDDLRHRPPGRVADRPPDHLPETLASAPDIRTATFTATPGGPLSPHSTSPTPTPSPPSTSERRWRWRPRDPPVHAGRVLPQRRRSRRSGGRSLPAGHESAGRAAGESRRASGRAPRRRRRDPRRAPHRSRSRPSSPSSPSRPPRSSARATP